jgi:hypothetical protein
MILKNAVLGLAVASLVLGVAGREARALTFTLNDTTNNVSATADFEAAPGGFEVIITNTEANTADAGHAISEFQFTVGGGFAAPTAWTEVMGTATDFSNPPTAVDDTPSGSPLVADHWQFQTSGSNTLMCTVAQSGGSCAPGGQPDHLIVAAGSMPNASLTGTHIPSFIGPTTFFFSDTSGAPTDVTQITDVQFAFGTGPEVTLEDTPPPSPVPEPASLFLVGSGFAAVGAAVRRRWGGNKAA